MGTPRGTKPWNAGTSQGWKDRRGYRWRRLPDGRKIREHRMIASQMAGRELEPWEIVHHKNGDVADNRLEITAVEPHNVAHHVNAKRPDSARRIMAAHAQMREEIVRLRRTKAELLAACREMLKAADELMTEFISKKRACDWGIVNQAMLDAGAAIRKATGLESI